MSTKLAIVKFGCTDAIIPIKNVIIRPVGYAKHIAVGDFLSLEDLIGGPIPKYLIKGGSNLVVKSLLKKFGSTYWRSKVHVAFQRLKSEV